jgi:uncharacterized membrane protein YhaH (DUF805 family)/ribosomal protein L40E
MALIKCPECNAEVSDRAEKCIKCGFPMASYVPPVKCPECGGESPGGAVTCGKCGFPLKEHGGNMGTSPPSNSGCVDVTNVAPHSDDLEVHDLVKKFSLWRGFVNGWKNSFNFKDRARRKEYWGWVLFTFLFNMGFIILTLIIATLAGEDEEDATSVTVVYWALVGAQLIPNIAISIRRTHDIDCCGEYGALMAIIFPVCGMISEISGKNYISLAWPTLLPLALIVGWFFITCKDGTSGDNKYGHDPKGREPILD